MASTDIFEKEASFATQIFAGNDYLDKATPESKLMAVMNVAQTGLTLNPFIKHAYLVPRYNGKTKKIECTLMPSYQGLTHMMVQSDDVVSVSAHVVRADDNFSYSLGVSPSVEHRPDIKAKSEIIAAYAVAKMKNGSIHVEVMGVEEINQARESSEGYKKNPASSPWTTWYGEMCRKTVTKRLSKYIPKSATPSWEQFGKAVELDDADYGYHEESNKVQDLNDKLKHEEAPVEDGIEDAEEITDDELTD
jgi:recombination protein RecT